MAFEPTHETVATNGIALHVATAGPTDGPLLILLHGFPEPWFGWRKQIGPLAEAGYRVLAPDQRGYNLSDKPAGIAAYSLDELASDIAGLIAAQGRSSARVVGHDWGGIVAWWLAIRRPSLVERLAIINAPHPVAFRRELIRNPAQLARSWYVFLIQLPGLPERLLSQGNFKRLANALRETSRPGTFPDEVLDEYRRAWSQPGALTAMLNWYRAAFRARPDRPADVRVHVPALIIWGQQDHALNPSLADAGLRYCDHGRLHRIDNATHWVPHEEPALVNRLLLEFLAEPLPTARRGPADDDRNKGAGAETC